MKYFSPQSGKKGLLKTQQEGNSGIERTVFSLHNLWESVPFSCSYFLPSSVLGWWAMGVLNLLHIWLTYKNIWKDNFPGIKVDEVKIISIALGGRWQINQASSGWMKSMSLEVLAKGFFPFSSLQPVRRLKFWNNQKNF